MLWLVSEPGFWCYEQWESYSHSSLLRLLLQPYWYCERIYKKTSTLWASTKKYLSLGNLYAREYANLQVTMGTHQTSR